MKNSPFVLLQGISIDETCRLADNLPCSVGDGQWHLAHDDLHHGEMLEVVVRLKQGVASVKLDQYAADGEEVTRERPAETCIELDANAEKPRATYRE